MAMDFLGLSVGMGYTDETVIGGGALKGKNCVVSNIEEVADGVNVTFQSILDDGTVKTDTAFIPKGTQGETGVAGKSAYEIWLEAGNTGTEEDFLISLVGEKGDDGKSAYQYAQDGGYIGTETEFTTNIARSGVISKELEHIRTVSSQLSSEIEELEIRVPIYDDYNNLINLGGEWGEKGATKSNDVITFKTDGANSPAYYHSFDWINYSGDIYVIFKYSSNKANTIVLEYHIDELTWQTKNIPLENTNGKFIYKIIKFSPTTKFKFINVKSYVIDNYNMCYTPICIKDSELLSVLDSRKVTPELFGCIGDGVFDNTNNLRNAFSICNKYGYTLHSQNNKVYYVNGVINVSLDNLNIDFDGATIKTDINNDNGFIEISNKNSADTKHYNRINNLTLDCSNNCGGIHITYGGKIIIDGLTVKNCKYVAYQVDKGHEVFLQNSHIHCNGNYDSVGIKMLTSDCHINDIVIVDARIAIYNEGTNFYSRVHAWNISIWEDTIFFYHHSGNVMMVECQADTYSIGWKYACSYKLSLIGCTYFINTSATCYSSSSDKNNIVISLSSSAAWYSRKIGVIGCNFAQSEHTQLCDKQNQIQFVDYGSATTVRPIIKASLISIFAEKQNEMFNRDGKTYLKVIADISNAEDTELLWVGDIPQDNFYPKYGYTHYFIAKFVDIESGNVVMREGTICEEKIYIKVEGLSLNGKRLYIDTDFIERNID